MGLVVCRLLFFYHSVSLKPQYFYSDGSKGVGAGPLGTCDLTLSVQFFLQFVQFARKNIKIIGLCLTFELLPPLGNSGSVTVLAFCKSCAFSSLQTVRSELV